ncbi:MAG: hypothetical protein FWB85_05080 [Chitinispirillia bacterium]|nr:hypothetical protein [Chitinispirillia bacterium]
MTRSIIYAILLLCAASAASPAPPPGTEPVSASDPHIRYTGRFDTRDPSNVRFDWPGNMIELRFGGSSCAVMVRGDGGRYDIYVNDSQFVARFDTVEAVHQLAAGLAASSTHSLRISKRFEGLKDQIAEIKGFYVDAGQSLHPLAHDRPAYRIELIGGSSMLGFGAEANTVYCANPAIYSNANTAFGLTAARALGAEAHMAAMTGKGLMRNWKSPFITAPHPFGHHYTRTLKNDSTSRWNFKSWTPHVTVVNFGTNDFSTRPYPPKETYIAQYRNFLDHIRARHPNVQIVCVASAREPVRTYIEELVKREQEEGNTAIHFYSYKQIPKRLSGCDWHPNAEAQAKIGAELAEVIRPLLK